MQNEDVTHRAVHRGRHAGLLPEVHHPAGEPAHLEWPAVLQIVVHRRGHFRRPAVEERDALLDVISGQRDAERAADGHDLTRQIDQKRSRERVAANRPDGPAHGGGRPGHGDEDDVFLPDRAPDVVADLGIDAALLASSMKGLDPLRAAAVIFSEHQPLQRAALRDHAGTADAGPDISHAAEQRLIAEDRPQHVVLGHAILKRDDAGLGRHDRNERACRALGIPQLDAEHHHVDRTDALGLGGDIDLRHVDSLRPAFDGETVLTHGGEMRTACDEMNVGSALHQPRAEIPADPAGPHDRNAHVTLPSQSAAAG